MGDRFTIQLTVEELIQYIRKTPKQFAHELPDKLEKWVNEKLAAYEKALLETSAHVSKTTKEMDPLRREIATRIMVEHAPHSSVNIELLADYCVDAADELLKRLER